MLDSITIAVRPDPNDNTKEVIIPLMSAQYDLPTKTWYVWTYEIKYVAPGVSKGSVMARGEGITLERAIEGAAEAHMAKRCEKGW